VTTIRTNTNPAGDPLAEVAVAAGVLQATADLLAHLAEFFDNHEQARWQLGLFHATNHLKDFEQDGIGDPRIEGALTVHQLTEAAELLHDLAAASAATNATANATANQEED
jgi:hypothetical protein